MKVLSHHLPVETEKNYVRSHSDTMEGERTWRRAQGQTGTGNRKIGLSRTTTVFHHRRKTLVLYFILAGSGIVGGIYMDYLERDKG
jgi:hypothetical protein